MNDITTQKIEPVVGSRPGDGGARPVLLDETVAGSVSPATRHVQPAQQSHPVARDASDQLGRIEEKAARIEEKFARSEMLFLRLQSTFEDAMSEFGGLARTANVAALEAQVARLPGLGALIVVAIVGVVLGAAATVAALKFGVPFVVLPR
jgi:hypothetical protein